ncbi:MAG TPA: hypothetical protein VJT31_18360 [Rugosimonospora sp.]|nr:hypothetical protein [Rugosimonospora sp.]
MSNEAQPDREQGQQGTWPAEPGAQAPEPVAPQSPWSAAPQQWPQPTSGAPAAETAQPVPPQFVWDSPREVWPPPAQPISGQPASVPPAEAQPWSPAAPVEAQPWSPGPVAEGEVPAWTPAPPVQSADTPYWPPVAAPQPMPWGTPAPQPAPPAITPSAPPARSRLLTGLLIGLGIAVLTGGGGYLVGHSTVKAPAKQNTPAAAATSYGALPPYEASQLALNKVKLDGPLATIAQLLLPWMGGCTADTDVGGAKLLPVETKHVYCRYGGTTVHFGLYKSKTARDAERAYREQLLLTSQGLAPGLADPGRKTGGVSGALGDYVEYTWKDSGLVWCGVWWDRDDSPLVAMRLEAPCEQGLGGSWTPLRDLWHRYS